MFAAVTALRWTNLRPGLLGGGLPSGGGGQRQRAWRDQQRPLSICLIATGGPPAPDLSAPIIVLPGGLYLHQL